MTDSPSLQSHRCTKSDENRVVAKIPFALILSRYFTLSLLLKKLLPKTNESKDDSLRRKWTKRRRSKNSLLEKLLRNRAESEDKWNLKLCPSTTTQKEKNILESEVMKKQTLSSFYITSSPEYVWLIALQSVEIRVHQT